MSVNESMNTQQMSHSYEFYSGVAKSKHALVSSEPLTNNQIAPSLPRKNRTRDELPYKDLPTDHELNRARKQKKITIYPDFRDKAEAFAKEQDLDFSTLVEEAIKFYAESKGCDLS